MGVSANGCHTNLSLWKGDKNLFLPEGDNPRMPSQLGLNAIGGILEHLRALTCITAPTVNSYRRFWEQGSGRRCSPTGATRTARRPCASPRPTASSTARSTRRSTRTSPSAALIDRDGGRHQPHARPGRPRGGQHLRGDRRRQEGPAGADDARRGPPGARRGRAREVGVPGEMHRVFTHYKNDEWERYCWRSATGTSRSTWTSCPRNEGRHR